jgi:transposase-like protein
MSDDPPAEPAMPDPVHPQCWTPQRQRAFLLALQATRSVAAAARHAGMSRQSAYRLLARKRGQAFARAWEAALDWRTLPGLGDTG